MAAAVKRCALADLDRGDALGRDELAADLRPLAVLAIPATSSRAAAVASASVGEERDVDLLASVEVQDEAVAQPRSGAARISPGVGGPARLGRGLGLGLGRRASSAGTGSGLLGLRLGALGLGGGARGRRRSRARPRCARSSAPTGRRCRAPRRRSRRASARTTDGVGLRRLLGLRRGLDGNGLGNDDRERLGARARAPRPWARRAPRPRARRAPRVSARARRPDRARSDGGSGSGTGSEDIGLRLGLGGGRLRCDSPRSPGRAYAARPGRTRGRAEPPGPAWRRRPRRARRESRSRSRRRARPGGRARRASPATASSSVGSAIATRTRSPASSIATACGSGRSAPAGAWRVSCSYPRPAGSRTRGPSGRRASRARSFSSIQPFWSRISPSRARCAAPPGARVSSFSLLSETGPVDERAERRVGTLPAGSVGLLHGDVSPGSTAWARG